MDKNLALVAAICAVMSSTSKAAAAVTDGPMSFEPIAGSAYAELTADAVVLDSEPWIVPRGFGQIIVSDEGKLDIYAGSDWPDMNTLNETGKDAGRYLYRTHEIRPRSSDGGAGRGAAVSVVDLKTGETRVLAQRADWEALDGIVWTPWGTLLVTEEAGRARLRDPDFPAAARGLVYELELDNKNPMRAGRIIVRPLLGSLAHEGIELDREGNVYVIDEDASGAIYKFVPKRYGDLSDGQLYALKVVGDNARDKTGPAEWVALDMSLARVDARTAADNVGATSYVRPEDIERVGDVLYVAITGESRVLSISLGRQPVVKNFVKAGLNAPIENRGAGVTGFHSPDNLANGPDGTLWIVEDNVPSDIWVALPDKDGDGASDGVHLFASLKDVAAEGSGIYFSEDARTLFVNVQHSTTGNDKTVAITRHEHKDKE